MRLDYNPATQAYILRIPRSDGELVQQLVREQGMNFSTSASDSQNAVLFTKEPYAAAAFADIATDRAKGAMGGMLDEINASFAPTTSWRPSWSPPHEELWDFQCADLEYALRRTNCLVGDQPGLGKTPIAISYANEIGARHVLVVCPANIRRQWERKIGQWSRVCWDLGRRTILHSISSSRRGVAPTADYPATWNIVSYDLARTPAIGTALARQRYDLVILDEAHYLKTTDAGRTRAIFGGGENRRFDPIGAQASRIMALSGTPLPNRPREAYTLARALCFDSIDWLSEEGFKTRFNPSALIEGERADGTRYRYVDERTGRHAELQNRLRANFMTRHLKREVMTQLKLPIYDLIRVDETGAVKQALAAERLLDINPDDLAGADAAVLGHVAVVRHMMGVALAPQVADYVAMLVDGGEEKLVVFAWHVDVLDILETKLRQYGTVRIDGSTSPSKKDALITQFIKDPRITIALGNIQAMGTGTDGLQEVCFHGLIAEPSWVGGENLQCFDRLDRGGQREQVQGEIFVAPGSIAERILASALRKLVVTDAALDKRLIGGRL